MVNFGLLTADIVSGFWGIPPNFNGFRVLAALLHGTLVIFMVALYNRADHYIFALWFLMAALGNRCGHYIFALWFVLLPSLFCSSPNLSGRRLDVCHTWARVALVRI